MKTYSSPSTFTPAYPDPVSLDIPYFLLYRMESAGYQPSVIARVDCRYFGQYAYVCLYMTKNPLGGSCARIDLPCLFASFALFVPPPPPCSRVTSWQLGIWHYFLIWCIHIWGGANAGTYWMYNIIPTYVYTSLYVSYHIWHRLFRVTDGYLTRKNIKSGFTKDMI